jgi:hypothetical protein
MRTEWVVGISWTAWLLLLCVLETGEGKSRYLVRIRFLVSGSLTRRLKIIYT